MVGDFYDDALAKKVNRPYKNELIHTWPWDTAPQSRLKNVAAPHVSTFPGGPDLRFRSKYMMPISPSGRFPLSNSTE